MRLNILHITPDFNYACGRSYYVFLLLKYLKREKHNVMLLTNGGDSFDRLEGEGIKYLIIKDLHSKNIIPFIRNVNNVKSIIREYNIGILHTHHRFSEFLAVQASKLIRARKVKTVFTSLSLVGKRYNIEYKSDKIIAVSHAVKDMLTRRFNVAERKITVIPNFTDTGELHNLAKLSRIKPRKSGKSFNILAIGRFHHEKNFEVLLKALNLLKDKKIKLILIGEGDRQDDYRTYIHRHHLNVTIVEPQKNLVEYYRWADLCVLPSARDPFPNFMIQSGLHRKPFIGSNVDGIAELISDRNNGLLFKSGNFHDLAEKIELFKTNHYLAQRCASRLHNEVIKHYTQEFIVPKIEKLYRN
jgi:glycosyltransferase involved in cell wall biosynthesis